MSFANVVHQTSDGGYILAGHIYLFINGSRVRNSYFWIIKIDSDGNELWNKTLNEGDAISIDQTSDGGYLFAGQEKVVKTNANGYMELNKSFIETGSQIRSVQQTLDGGNILIGQTYTHTTWEGECKNGFCWDKWIPYYDNWLKKTDSYGESVWKKILFQNSTSFFPNSAQQTFDGGYLIQGKEETKIWLIKTDSDGNKKWNKTLNMNDSGNIILTQQTKDGGYILAGSKRKSSGNNDVWIVKIAGEPIEQIKTQSILTPTAISNETYMAGPKEKASGFEIVLSITILLMAIIIKRMKNQ